MALANDLESAGRTHLRAARWLRARALETVDRVITFSPAPLGEMLAAMIAGTGDLEVLQNLFDASVGRMERLGQLRDGLRHAGVDEDDPLAADQLWKAAARRLAEDLAPALRAGLDATGARLLTRVDRRRPGCVVEGARTRAGAGPGLAGSARRPRRRRAFVLS